MTDDPNTLVREGEVAGKIGAYYGVLPSDPRISSLLAKVFPEVRLAAAGDPASWQSAFLGVIAKYDGYAKELGLGASQTQRDIDVLRNANRTDANFVGALGRLGWDGTRHYATMQGGGSEKADGGARSGERPSSAALGREPPLSATGAIGFAKELGMNPAHAGFFVGASSDMRGALRDAIKNGTAITDDKVTNMRDVSAVMGAIRSGKLRPDDPRIPPSVQQIVKDMKAKGIDPASAKPEEIKKYLKDHPEALKGAKAAVKKDTAAVAGLSEGGLGNAIRAEAAKTAPKATPTTKDQSSKKPVTSAQVVPRTL